MAITQNRVYSDPNLGAAFSNIAQMFAPPSAGDLAGYATANAKNAEASRLADFYAGVTGYSTDEFDRRAAALGIVNPTQGFGARNMDDATKRYGYDTQAATSRANNAATNQQALLSTLYGPLSENQTRPALPDGIASMYGLPEIAPERGIVNVAQGERSVLPDGTVIDGAAKPLSETEVLGSILQGLPAQDQRARALQGVDLAKVQGADGLARYVFEPDAVGMTPAPSASGGTPRNYVAPGGQRGVTLNGTTDAATGAAIPAGAQIFGTNVQGSATETGIAPTVANQTESNKTEAVLNAMDADITAMEQLLRNNPGVAGAPGAIRGFAQNLATSVGEVLGAYGKDMSAGAAVMLEDVQQAAQMAAPNRDPAIAQFNVGLANMAYRLAQMNNPSGEVSRQAFERAMETLSGGLFANNQSTLEALGAMRGQVNRNREAYLGTLRAPGQETPTAPAAPAAADGIPTVATPEEARMLPSGTQFRDPQGNLRVVP